MFKKQKKNPFQTRYDHLVEDWGLKPYEAIKEIEKDRREFKETHDRQMRVHLDASNNAQISRIGHVTTLATLTVTIAGFLSTQFSESVFNEKHKIILILIIISEFLSLVFSVRDYKNTIIFHATWAKTHMKINDQVSTLFDSGELQTMNDMIAVQDDCLANQIEKTSELPQKLMVNFALFGLGLVVLLFYAYFFDVPGSW